MSSFFHLEVFLPSGQITQQIYFVGQRNVKPVFQSLRQNRAHELKSWRPTRNSPAHPKTGLKWAVREIRNLLVVTKNELT